MNWYEKQLNKHTDRLNQADSDKVKQKETEHCDDYRELLAQSKRNNKRD